MNLKQGSTKPYSAFVRKGTQPVQWCVALGCGVWAGFQPPLPLVLLWRIYLHINMWQCDLKATASAFSLL